MRIKYWLPFAIAALVIIAYSLAHASTVIKSGPSGGDTPQIACNSSALAASTTGEVALVAAVAGESVYVCGYTIVGSGAATVDFTEGTGSTCGTSNVQLSGLYLLGASTTVTDASPYYRGLSTFPGDALCINSTTGAAAGVTVYYTQF